MVTASTAGIGLAIAERMAQEGGIVHICSRKADNVTKAVNDLKTKGLTIHGHVCNVGKADERA